MFCAYSSKFKGVKAVMSLHLSKIETFALEEPSRHQQSSVLCRRSIPGFIVTVVAIPRFLAMRPLDRSRDRKAHQTSPYLVMFSEAKLETESNDQKRVVFNILV